MHIFKVHKCFFENSIHKLKPGGVYIIEDIHTEYLFQYYKYIEQYKQSENLYFNIITNEKFKGKMINNNLLYCYKIY